MSYKSKGLLKWIDDIVKATVIALVMLMCATLIAWAVMHFAVFVDYYWPLPLPIYGIGTY